MNYSLKLNLSNLQINPNTAHYQWTDPSSAAAHEGVTLSDQAQTQVSGFDWIDITRQRVNLPSVYQAQVKESSTLTEAFQKTAEVFDAELKATLDQAPPSTVFDFDRIKQSQTLTYN